MICCNDYKTCRSCQVQNNGNYRSLPGSLSRYRSSRRLKPAYLRLLSVAILLASSSLLRAQCRLPENRLGRAGDTTANSEPLLPEAGLLTNDNYTSLYFGFSLHLPIPLEGHRIMLPIQLPGEHALLAIGFQNGQHYGTFEITAGGRREDDSHLTRQQAKEREDEISRGKPATSDPVAPEFAPPPVHFKRVDKHAGEVRGTQYTAPIRDYTVRVTIQTNDKTFLEKSRAAVEAVRLYCTDQFGRLYTPEGRELTPAGTPTHGPTIPTAVVDEAIRSRPAEKTIPMSSGFANGEYRNSGLELSYALPPGWGMSGEPPADAKEPSDDERAKRLEYLWKSCARTLLRARAGPGAANGAFLELYALDQSCLALPAPASATDWFASETLGQYLQMLGRFGKIKANSLVESAERVFSVYQSTVAAGPAAENLERRDVQVIVVTRYRKLLLAWCWSAAAESQLRAIRPTNVIFGDAAPIAIGPGMSGAK